MDTIGYILSQLRNDLKAVKQDAFLTDRYLYSKVMKFVPALLKREDGKNLLMNFVGIWQSIPYVELIEVSKVESKCFHLRVECTIKRTEHKLPNVMDGYYGPLIKSVYAISGPATDADDEAELQMTTPAKFASIVKSTTYKYNRTKYFWYHDGYLWFPDLEWDAIRVDGLFDGDLSEFDCKDCEVDCVPQQDTPFSVPKYLYPELLGFVQQELMKGLNIPQDEVDDKKNLNRS